MVMDSRDGVHQEEGEIIGFLFIRNMLLCKDN